MRVIGKDLIFVSRIMADGRTENGSETKKCFKQFFHKCPFELTCLSIAEQTYIACGFWSFVVKLKKKAKVYDNS